MVVRTVRAVLFVGLVLAMWAVARPARAASLAPFCDDRGATALAAPPALEASDEAVRRAAVAPSPCGGDEPLLGLAFARAHGSASGASAPVEPARTIPVLIVSPPSSQSANFVAYETPPAQGVRYRVERPPRA